MKKCRVTLADAETKTKFFYLFQEPKLLHSLVCSTSRKNLDKLLKTHPEVELVSLKKGQWLEVEWNGCEIFYNGKSHVSTTFFRLIKAAYVPKKNSDSSLLSIHFGWMLSDHLRITDGEKNGIKIELLKLSDEQYEFSELFQDNETVEDMIKKQEQEKII